MSVAHFYEQVLETLAQLGVGDPGIMPVPVEVPAVVPFLEDRVVRPYDREKVRRWLEDHRSEAPAVSSTRAGAEDDGYVDARRAWPDRLATMARPVAMYSNSLRGEKYGSASSTGTRGEAATATSMAAR